MTGVVEAGSGAANAREAGEDGPGLGRSGRMSRARKREAVLRLLRGEDLETVSRALGVTAATLSGWRDAFLAAGEAALATRQRRGTGERPLEGQARRGPDRAGAAGREGRRPGGRPPFGPREAEAVSRTVSPVSGRPYGLALVCRVWRLARSTVYRHREPPRAAAPRRPGPVGPMPTCWRRSGRCWRPAPSTARATARCGRDCATAAPALPGAGCCG